MSVEGADAAAGRVREAGGRVTLEPQDVMDLGRTAVFADPGGRGVRGLAAGPAGRAGRRQRARELELEQSPRARPRRRRPFYGAVFGWEAATVEFGAGMESTMFRLPGYGDFLAERDPGTARAPRRPVRAARVQRRGRWLEPLAADAPPRWHVTFSAADTDASPCARPSWAARCSHGPFSAGPVRLATLRDPQGAAFSVNTYPPPGG